MKDEYEYRRQINKVLDHIMRLIHIDEQIAQGKKKGVNVVGDYIDLKRERTKLKHQIHGYIQHTW